MVAADTLLEQREIDLLRWRSRRGLVENDLYIERFFTTYGHQLTQRHADAWTALMNLADNDLMDLFLRRTEPQGDLDTPEVTAVLEMVRKR
ncbi:MAG: succinate dehydrogenase assembly factor 2 [Comamonas sp.]|jgi:antitoxin CptB|uniref:FAD assembly factor SdhE n=1 Tax=Comamonas denitrificans TaxID=117506 RepID=UPI001B672C04|nr:succinate dehydrogenase assembly factor 2 [Comamonas sp.]MBP7840636.1 succinate dehydrogenase assembly factor 2 [Comamonas sp.]MBP7855151.1 succinate dehydrogenase assembly factor 2 [Comamonas sp.]MBP7871739.1 succinate dehydrogenase assembly factor 2 [Comamonas sp.]MBP8711142.1 succinate dehydrogenase assembly factor 2 [Comamonas sp.]